MDNYLISRDGIKLKNLIVGTHEKLSIRFFMGAMPGFVMILFDYENFYMACSIGLGMGLFFGVLVAVFGEKMLNILKAFLNEGWF